MVLQFHSWESFSEADVATLSEDPTCLAGRERSHSETLIFKTAVLRSWNCYTARLVVNCANLRRLRGASSIARCSPGDGFVVRLTSIL